MEHRNNIFSGKPDNLPTSSCFNYRIFLSMVFGQFEVSYGLIVYSLERSIPKASSAHYKNWCRDHPTRWLALEQKLRLRSVWQSSRGMRANLYQPHRLLQKVAAEPPQARLVWLLPQGVKKMENDIECHSMWQLRAQCPSHDHTAVYRQRWRNWRNHTTWCRSDRCVVLMGFSFIYGNMFIKMLQASCLCCYILPKFHFLFSYRYIDRISKISKILFDGSPLFFRNLSFPKWSTYEVSQKCDVWT